MTTLAPCLFVFDDSPVFDGFAHGTTWNGFDNVAVTPATLDKIVAYFREIAPGCEDTEEGNRDMLAIEPMADGLISLAFGYATQIVEEDWGTAEDPHYEAWLAAHKDDPV